MANDDCSSFTCYRKTAEVDEASDFMLLLSYHFFSVSKLQILPGNVVRVHVVLYSK